MSSCVRCIVFAKHRIIRVVGSWEIEGGRRIDVVVVDDVDDGCRDLVVDFGVMICRTGERDGTGWEGTGESFFKGENKSKSSKLTRSTVFDGCGRGRTGWETVVGDFWSVIVRLRLRAGVCDDETDGERDRWRCCFRVFVVTDESSTSMGTVSSTTQCFSFVFVRSYSASDTNGVNFDFFFFTGD